MTKRIEAIDALRGITIFMMILCASIASNANLPAWMFHCQVPPPDYVFKPEVRGLTWVDMVFPIFIFAMGAAIPYWLGSKLKNGQSIPSICLQIARRTIILIAFSLAIGHGDAISGTSIDPMFAGVVQFVLWLCMFAALWRTKYKYVNYIGWGAIVAVFIWMHFSYGLEFNFAQNDCIILLLAWVALMGGFIWLFTREKPLWRVGIWCAVAIAKFAGFDFTQYLVIAIPATLAGDLLKNYEMEKIKDFGASAWVAFAAVILQLWGLFTREVLIDLWITLALATVFFCLNRKNRSVPVKIGTIGFVMLIGGILFDFIDGGIAKDYCNLSYLFTTGGQSMLLLFFLLWAESRHRLSRNLVMSGRNPMIAYTIAWSVITPFLYIVGLLGLLDSASAGNPLMGTVRGFVVTLATIAVTCLFTKFDIYWKS